MPLVFIILLLTAPALADPVPLDSLVPPSALPVGQRRALLDLTEGCDLYLTAQGAPCAADPYTLDALLDAPHLLSAIWNASGFAPAYRVTPNGFDRFHVEDPNGVSGDVQLIHQGPGIRLYRALGSVTQDDSLLGRISAEGSAVLVFVWRSSGDPRSPSITPVVHAYVRAHSRLLGLASRALLPLLRERIDRRLAWTLQGGSQIVHQTYADPGDVCRQLEHNRSARALVAEYRARFMQIGR